MPSNDFLTPGTTTSLTLVYDSPREGQTRYGPYRAYRVRTDDGTDHTFFPPRSLYPELDRLQLGRGSHIAVTTSQRVSEDGRVFPKYEITPIPSSPGSAPPIPGRAPASNGILASVALKAAASAGSTFSEPEAVLKVAERYLTWLVGHA